MTGVFFDPLRSDEAWRDTIYQGGIIILSPTPEMLAFVEHARSMIEDAFAPLDPQRAHESLPVERCVEILTTLKPSFIYHPHTTELIQPVLSAFGCASAKTYQDVPRLRCAFPSDYLTTGIAYAHHPHRDTLVFGASMSIQLVGADLRIRLGEWNGLSPPLLEPRGQEWITRIQLLQMECRSRRNASQHIGRDTRVQPHAEEPLELEPGVRFVVPPGGVIVFSGAQLHSTVPNTANMVRWSIGFRTVNFDDLVSQRGAPNVDSASTGTSLRDFLPVADLAPLPGDVVAAYDNGLPADGVAVFKPEMSGASVS